MSKVKVLVASWNREYVKKTSKDKFIKAHLHLADENVLSDEYDKIVPPKEKDKK